MQEKQASLPLTRVDNKGQIMLPDEIRRKLGVRPGDIIEFQETEQGFLMVARSLVKSQSDREFEADSEIEAQPITVLVADNTDVYRIGLRSLLRVTSDMEQVGEASTGGEVIRLAAEYQPDVILMDMRMETDTSGIEATRRILEEYPRIHILLLTVSEADEDIFNAMCAGARGYLFKTTSLPDEILNAIRFVNKGGTIFGQTMADKTLRYFERLRATWPQEETQKRFPQLNEGERNILMLLAQGYSTAQIADHMSFTPKTVRNYISNILRELGVANRTAAVILAQEAGLGKESLER